MFTAIWALSSHRSGFFSPAAVYLVLGALASAGLSLLGIDLLDPIGRATLIEHLAEFAVIVTLFGAGLRLDRRLGWAKWRSTILLIAVVMPLTIGAVTLFASAFMGLSLGAAIVLGACLAPTDPVLAREIKVGPPGTGDRTETHFALTSEAGLNDGLAFPFVFLGLYVAGDGGTDWLAEWLAADVVYAIAVGIAIGVVGGRLIGAGADWLRQRGWLRPSYDGWLALAAVLAIYGVTEIAGAYGFLAAFAGGLSFRRYEWDHEAHDRVHGGSDLLEKVSELGLVLLLGSTVTMAGLAIPGLAGWLLVPVLLVLIRPASVLASFAGSPVKMGERLLIGWFGIRGIGSFYYAAVAINAGVLSTGEVELIYWTIIACVGVSILVHGFSARPAMASLPRSGQARRKS
ncbi:MAG: cation:proton antiporter [Solirubrobacterales bacterium]|nr:cation:proton antiporter [Solirubrobacterales bacterium]